VGAVLGVGLEAPVVLGARLEELVVQAVPPLVREVSEP
jgi:hypothetical protein